MANIIEIILTATDLASPKVREYVQNLERVRRGAKDAAADTQELDEKTKKLLATYRGGKRDVADIAEQFTLFDDALDATNLETHLKRREIALREYEKGLGRVSKAAKDTAEQLSFFERSGNALGGQFRSNVTGRFVAEREASFAERERPMERIGDDLVPVIRQVESLHDALENVDEEVKQITIDFEDGSRQMSFGDINAEAFDLENRLRGIRRASSDINIFDDLKLDQLDASLEQVVIRLRQERDAFAEVGEAAQVAHLDRRINQVETIRQLGLTNDELEEISHKIPAVAEALDDYHRRTHSFNSSVDDTNERLRVMGDRLQSERGVLGGLRRLARQSEQKFFETLSGGVRKFGGSVEEADEAFLRFQKNFVNLSNIDETIGIGFARIARFMAVVIAALPVVTTLFGVLAGAVVAAGGGVVALGSALGTLTGLLATLPGLLTAAVAGFGSAFAVFGPEISKLFERAKEIKNQEDQARKNTTRNAEEVRNAEENIADTRLRNAEQVANAEESLQEARRAGAEQTLQIEEQIAQTKERNARQERNAVEALNDLRRRNNREEKDLRRDIARERLKVEEDVKKAVERLHDLQKRNAELERKLTEDLTGARAELAGLRAEGASPTSIANAQARLANSERNLRQFAVGKEKREERDAERDLAKLRKTNAEQLIDLQERLRRAKADNNREETRAVRNLGELRKDNTKEIVALEERLARSRESSARQVARAERELGRVRRTNIQQVRDAEERLVASRRRAAGEVGDPFEGLDDTEVRVVKLIGRIKDSFESLTAGPRNRGVAFMERVLDFLDQRMPRITQTVNKFADAFLRVADNAFTAFFENGQNVGIINGLLEDGLVIFEQFGNALVTVAEAMLMVADAARPLTRAVGNVLESGANKFREVVAGGSVKRGGSPGEEGTSQLDDFFAATQRVAGILGSTFSALGDALLDIAKIAEPFGETILRTFEEFAQKVSDFTSSPDGKEAIREFFEDATPAAIKLGEVVGGLVETFFRIGRALIRPGEGGEESFITKTLNSILDALPGFEKFVVESTEKNGPKLFRFFGEMVDIVGELIGPGGAFTVMIDVIGQMLHAFNTLPEPVRKFIVVLVALGGPIGLVLSRLAALRRIIQGFAQSGTFAVLLGGKFKILLVILIAFPAILKKLIDAVDLLFDALNLLLKPIDALGEALGIGGSNLTTGVLLLATAFKSVRVAIVGAARAMLGFMLQMARAALVATFARIIRLLVAGFYALRAATIAWGLALTATGIGAIAVAIGLIIVAIVELERRFHVFSRLARFAQEQIQRFLDYLRNHWKKALLLLFLAPFIAIPALLAVAAKKIGPAIIDGIVKGLSGLKDAIVQKFKDAWNGVKGFFHISSPSLTAADEVGKPIAQGIEQGITQGVQGMGDRVGAALAAELDKALKIVEDNMEKTISRIESKVSGIDTQLSAKFDAQQEELTPSERALERMDAQDTARQRSQQKAEANAQVREAEKTRAATAARLAKLLGGGGVVTAANAAQRRAQAFNNRDEIAATRRTLAQQDRALREAQKARGETFADIARQEQRERLERQAQAEREARDKAIEQERKTVQARFDAIVAEINKAIKQKDAGALGKARQKLIKFFADQGIAIEGGRVITQGLTQGMVTSIEGLLTQVRISKTQIVKALTLSAQQRKAIQDSWKFSFDYRVVKQKGRVGPDPRLSRAAGGTIPGAEGEAVDIIAHAGEWVLNRKQQAVLAGMTGTSPALLQASLFSRQAAPRTRFASGGVVGGADKSNVHIPVTINTASPQVDAEYLSRVLESRMRTLP